jgi:hypothetical protein
MIRKPATVCWTLALLILLPGCAKPPAATQSGEVEKVRQAFTAFQAALKAGDSDQLWSLLDAESQADADRVAQTVRDAYAKADAAGRADLEKRLGIPGEDLASLNGKAFLKTKRFLGKYHEVPDSKIAQVAVQGEQATVNYVEADGDKEKFSLVRQGGQWKLSVPIPTGVQP